MLSKRYVKKKARLDERAIHPSLSTAEDLHLGVF